MANKFILALLVAKRFGNDWVAGAPRGLQHRCLVDKAGVGFDSQAFPQSLIQL
ncbi:uncharacterized protein METZ01_LOCUS246237 [marine metagenome]|uniref:Uncharacterized protein n=1 Tax=marine metagenome TaxID=408172 RepID=A0A382I3H2_9ZZZZ